jgi:hypothetical protein
MRERKKRATLVAIKQKKQQHPKKWALNGVTSGESSHCGLQPPDRVK